jgi:hypothetical protein
MGLGLIDEQSYQRPRSERSARRRLDECHLQLQKSGVRNLHADNLGGYRITENDLIVAGPNFDLTLEDVYDITDWCYRGGKPPATLLDLSDLFTSR